MLETAGVAGGVEVVVVWVSKEVVTGAEHIGAAEVGRRETGTLGLAYLKELLGGVVEVFADFEAEIGVGFTVSDDFYGVVNLNAAVVGGDDDFVAAASHGLEQLTDGRVAEPAEGDAAEGLLVADELMNHLVLGLGVRQNVDEIDDKNVEVVVQEVFELPQQFVDGHRVVELVVCVALVAPETLHEGLEELGLVEVFSFFFAFFYP